MKSPSQIHSFSKLSVIFVWEFHAEEGDQDDAKLSSSIVKWLQTAEEGDQDDFKLSSSIVKWLQTGHTCPCIATLCPLTAA